MKTIGVFPSLPSGLKRTLDALGDVFTVRFEERSSEHDSGIDAWFLHSADQTSLDLFSRAGLPLYAVINSMELVSCGDSQNIDFSGYSDVLSVLSGRRITADEAVGVKALPKWLENITVLASKADSPIWATHVDRVKQCHYVALPVPELQESELLFQHFNGRKFLQLLPLLIFLRKIADDTGWVPPPLQACFMFDDPNLHWRTYGFIDFAQIAEHAKLHKYHVCFATIPQDGWFIHMPTAALFRQYSDQLSLVIHGNDHIKAELARPCSGQERGRYLRQALARIYALERRSGLEVGKVMVPPHGAFNESYLGDMALLGFESACVSTGSLFRYNRNATWLRTQGMRPSDVIAGLTVLPRQPFSNNGHISILIAALLHQPIILMGHHKDVSGGLQILADVSGFVNSLGMVKWTDMKSISRGHYARRFDGQSLQVRMFSKRITISIPEGVNQIRIERPWLHEGESEPLARKILCDKSEWIQHHPHDPVLVQSGQEIELRSGLSTVSLINKETDWNVHIWPIIRRQLTEARDRLTPLLLRINL